MSEWKKCGENKSTIYEISDLGICRSIKKKSQIITILKPWETTGKYLTININKKNVKLHCLVAYAFLGERPTGYVIDHIDRNPQNNKLQNLRYCSNRDNCINSCKWRTDINEMDKRKRTNIINRESEKKKQDTITICECGVKTNLLSLKKHLKSKVHTDRLNNKEKYFFCECGCVVVNYPSKVERHYKSSKHLSFMLTRNP
jgi:hypothetical protein